MTYVREQACPKCGGQGADIYQTLVHCAQIEEGGLVGETGMNFEDSVRVFCATRDCGYEYQLIDKPMI